MRQRRVIVPVGIIDVRLLPRPTRKNPVGGNRAHRETRSEKRPHDLHELGMGGHTRKHLAFRQQVPDAPLQVDRPGFPRRSLKVSDFGRGVLRLTHDDGARIGDFLCRKKATDSDGA